MSFFHTALIIWGSIGVAACLVVAYLVHHRNKHRRAYQVSLASDTEDTRNHKIIICFLCLFLCYNLVFFWTLSGIMAYKDGTSQPVFGYVSGAVMVVLTVIFIIEAIKPKK